MTSEYGENSPQGISFVSNIERLTNKPSQHLHSLTREPALPTSSATKTILTAAHWGPMLVETDGENVISSRGALDTPFANSLQTAVREQVHSKTRVRYPMVRKGYLASPQQPQGVRGRG